ncbi:protein FAR1-RELATED SEQUENCE 5-like [Nymphaea colorata]|nr:protein FAR1-RELATED SEQUENCE 5-like [Nymphaea colorata]
MWLLLHPSPCHSHSSQLLQDMVNHHVEISALSMVNDINDHVKRSCPMEDITLDGYVPKVGMEFDDEETAFQFYNLYARNLGFSVRIHNWRKNSKGLLVRKELVCYKEGYPRTQKKHGIVQMKPNARCGCPAKLHLKRGLSGKLCVVEFEPIHNHPLASQNKVHMLRSHRNAPNAGVADRSGSTPKKQAGERKNLAFLSMDFKNYLRTKGVCLPARGDMGSLMQYLATKSANDPSFFSSVQLDSDDLITIFFWADGRSRVDYDCFGDVFVLTLRSL